MLMATVRRNREQSLRLVEIPESASLPKLVSVKKAAEILGISRSKLYELVAARQVAAYRPGGVLRVDEGSLADYLRGVRL